jgi:hypothetical protein
VSRAGQVAALNAGREAATGTILAITDDDAVPTPGWLRGIERHFADAGVGAVGGRDVVYEGGVPLEPPAARRVGAVLWYGRAIGFHHHPSHRQDVQFLKGANMAYRAELLRPFDERLWGSGAQVCNDLEASLSVWARGWRVVFDPDVTVDHHPAPRHDGARAAPSRAAVMAEAHNELYSVLVHLTGRRAVAAAAYAFLVGHRMTPGLVRGALGLLRGRRPGGEQPATVAALLATRVRAVRDALDQRRARDAHRDAGGRPAAPRRHASAE